MGILTVVNDRDEEVRLQAVDALGKVGPAAAEAAAELVVVALRDTNKEVRLRAVDALRKTGPAAVRARAAIRRPSR